MDSASAARTVVSHLGAQVSRRVAARGIADRGLVGHVVHRERCSSWPTGPGPLRSKLADATGYPHTAAVLQQANTPHATALDLACPHVPVIRVTSGQSRSLLSSVNGYPQVNISLVRTMIHARSSKLATRLQFPSPARPRLSAKIAAPPDLEGSPSCVAAASRDQPRATALRTALSRVSAAEGLRPLREVNVRQIGCNAGLMLALR
jgi:hypothetical protein